MRTRLSICAKKARFPSAQDALLAANHASVSLRPYRCDRCRQFHLTSRTKGKRVPRRIPTKELIGGVAQVQATVQAAIERYTPRLNVTDREGDPSGDPVFNIDPRAFLVIGNLDEFASDNGINVSKFRSFECFRRNIRRPEILTFDELLNRARFIVEHERSST